MATDNIETRVSVLEANHATLRESLADIKSELHGLRTAFDAFRQELQGLSERLIQSFDHTANCQTTVIPALMARLDNHEGRIVKAEDELEDSRSFKGQVRAWRPAFITGIAGAVVAAIVGAVKLATEVYWKMHGGM